MTIAFAPGVELAPLTTFELGGAARWFVEVADEDELVEALRAARDRSLPVLILGGGSNLVVSDAGFEGLVIRLALRGVTIDVASGRVTAAAGEPWDPLVAQTVEQGLAGLECLSGIPGLVGATPIQNVGAYGQEVSETIVTVRTVDMDILKVRERGRNECGFRYRHSMFKEPQGRREVVTSVTFELRAGGPPTVRYPELEKALVERERPSGSPRTLASVRDAVIALRRSKSMVIDPDDPNRRSAGSFFMNPIMSRAAADDVLRRAVQLGVVVDPRDLPRFEAGNGQVKLAAGWLIERAGFAKGMRIGPVGISTKHALALVHHGGGTAAELVTLAHTIIAGVEARFGVKLEPEPVLVGFTST